MAKRNKKKKFNKAEKEIKFIENHEFDSQMDDYVDSIFIVIFFLVGGIGIFFALSNISFLINGGFVFLLFFVFPFILIHYRFVERNLLKNGVILETTFLEIFEINEDGKKTRIDRLENYKPKKNRKYRARIMWVDEKTNICYLFWSRIVSYKNCLKISQQNKIKVLVNPNNFYHHKMDLSFISLKYSLNIKRSGRDYLESDNENYLGFELEKGFYVEDTEDFKNQYANIIDTSQGKIISKIIRYLRNRKKGKNHLFGGILITLGLVVLVSVILYSLFGHHILHHKLTIGIAICSLFLYGIIYYGSSFGKKKWIGSFLRTFLFSYGLVIILILSNVKVLIALSIGLGLSIIQMIALELGIIKNPLSYRILLFLFGKTGGKSTSGSGRIGGGGSSGGGGATGKW